MIDLVGTPFFLDDAGIAWVQETLAAMTTDEKVGQLFTLTTYTSDEDHLTDLVTRVRPSGVMCRPMPAADVFKAVRVLQENSRIPLLIAANLEKGADGIATEGTNLGTPMQIAATDDPAMAVRLGVVAGQEGMALGANWAFAPIVDLDLNFRNPITNTRTFGSDPARVIAMSEAYIRAVEALGMAATPKHFPGDGVDERDQHLATTSNDLGVEEWESTYGRVWRACIAAGAKSIMAGHLTMPAWSRRLRPGTADRDLLPASLAPELLNDLLREHLGFNGLIVSDATTMAGFTVPMPRSKAVPGTIAAGCDVFLFTRDLDEDLAFMRAGVADGTIRSERLDEAVTRILALKASLGLHQRAAQGTLVPDPATSLPLVGTAEHGKWASEVAERAITLVKDTAATLPIDPVRHRRVLLHDIHGAAGFYDTVGAGAEDVFTSLLEEAGFEVTRFAPRSGFEGLLTPSTEMADNYDVIIYLARLATRSNQTTVRIEWSNPMGANVPTWAHSVPTVFISIENPYHLLDVPRVPTYINTYSPSEPTIRALVDKLLGRSPFTGVSPVDPYCGRWDARL